jgi:hypothetical protein
MQIRKSTGPSVRTGKVITKKPVSKLAKKRTQKTKQKVVFFLVLALVALVAYVFVMRSEALFIRTIQINGVDSSRSESITKDTEEYLNTHYVWLLPKRNIFLFSAEEAREKLLLANTYIEKVEYKRVGLNTLIVDITPRSPRFVVVESKENLQPIAYIDSSGYIFSGSLYTVATNTIPVFESAASSTSTEKLPVHFTEKIGTILDEYYISNILFYVNELQKRNIKVEAIQIKHLNDVDLYITANHGALRINLTSDRDKTLATFFAAKKSEPLRTYMAENIDNLQYVDLRFGNKVFYKFK